MRNKYLINVAGKTIKEEIILGQTRRLWDAEKVFEKNNCWGKIEELKGRLMDVLADLAEEEGQELIEALAEIQDAQIDVQLF